LSDVTEIEQRGRELAVELGLLGRDEPAEITPLTGGVSSDILLVRTDRQVFCVKFALEQLRVAQVWKAPVHRNAADYQWLSYVSGFAPQAVPQLLGRSEWLGGFAMQYLESADYPNWKAELMAGRTDIGFAGAVGQLIGAIHARAARPETRPAGFDNQVDFAALRVEPYLLATAAVHPDLADRMRPVAERLLAARISLVHGDVSPKNILKGPHGPVILDAECAVIGDPAFDLGFCLNHLLIKASAALATVPDLIASANALWAGYRPAIDWESPDVLERRTAELLPMLMLARIDGKSPVEYLNPRQRDDLRSLSRRLIQSGITRLEPIFHEAAMLGSSR
jgi:aminoglycoside phosphotransferase (APT) family kinase protein